MRNGCITLVGVKHVTIELNRHGGRCVMLITDPTMTAYLIAQDGAESLMAGRGQSWLTQIKGQRNV